MLPRASSIVLALLVACGGGSQRPRGEVAFALVIDVGSSVELTAGERSHVVLAAVGAGSAPVSFAVRGLPAWAKLDGSVVTLAPTYADVGTYDVTVTATAGVSSDSEPLRIVVVAASGANHFPTWQLGTLFDELRPNRPVAPSGCYGTPWLEVTLADEDGDPVRGEVEVVPAMTPATGTPSYVTPWLETSGLGSVYGGRLALTGLVPGEPYDVVTRVVDARGGTYGWWLVIAGVRCVPVGLDVPYLEVYAGETRAFPLVVHGVAPGEPFTITATGLPAGASLDGATLTVTAPVGLTAVRTYVLDLTLAAGGYTYTASQEWLYLRP